jgi:hypothetical protein
LFLIVIDAVERVDKASSEYCCSGVGLMFFSSQTMNMAGLRHRGQSGDAPACIVMRADL